MKTQAIVFGLLILASAAPVAAQHGAAPDLSYKAPAEASQFDFLVGQWEVVVEPHVSGLVALIHGSPKFPGVWKVWRGLDGWGIEDEIRLTDESGNPRALTHSVRVYDAQSRRWNQTAVDVYRATMTSSTAEWRDGEMRVDGRGTDPDGRAYVSRTRFHSISAAGFQVLQDRSYDDGRTWTEGFMKTTAKRVAATAPR